MERLLQRWRAGQNETTHTQIDVLVEQRRGLFVAADKAQRRALAAQRAETAPESLHHQVVDTGGAIHLVAPGPHAVATATRLATLPHQIPVHVLPGPLHHGP